MRIKMILTKLALRTAGDQSILNAANPKADRIRVMSTPLLRNTRRKLPKLRNP